MAEGGEGMTPAEKAAKLEGFASYRTGCDKPFSDLLLEAAAHFRALIPDANGLLPCPMCGPEGEPVIIGTFPGDFNAACQTCLLRTGYCMTKADAIAAWNRRAGVAYE